MAYYQYKPTSELYHYCSLATFEGIIKSKQIWLSDISASNDPRELRLGYDWLVQLLNEYKFRTFPIHRADFFRFVGNQIIPYLQKTRFYCCCLSLARDNLPMWNSYGDACAGLCIGFRPTAMDGIPARIQKVNYIDNDTKKQFEDMLFGFADDYNRRGLNESNIRYVLEAVSDVVSAITSTKHRTWDHEKEIRILFAQLKLSPLERGDMRLNLASALPDGKIVPWTRPSERDSAGAKVPYLPFNFGKYQNGVWDPRRAIARVFIGPKCLSTETSINFILEEAGFVDYQIERSSCEIR